MGFRLSLAAEEDIIVIAEEGVRLFRCRAGETVS